MPLETNYLIDQCSLFASKLISVPRAGKIVRWIGVRELGGIDKTDARCRQARPAHMHRKQAAACAAEGKHGGQWLVGLEFCSLDRSVSVRNFRTDSGSVNLRCGVQYMNPGRSTDRSPIHRASWILSRLGDGGTEREACMTELCV